LSPTISAASRFLQENTVLSLGEIPSSAHQEIRFCFQRKELSGKENNQSPGSSTSQPVSCMSFSLAHNYIENKLAKGQWELFEMQSKASQVVCCSSTGNI